MTLDHRPMQAQDIETICTFCQSAEELSFMFPQATYPLTPDWFLSAGPVRHDPTVALLNGRIAGYANFAEVQEKHFCALGDLGVGPEYRRKGVATYLLGNMVQIALNRYAVRFVRASCFSHNKAAYALYYKLGFRPADLAQRLGPDGEPVLLVHLHLHRRSWSWRQAHAKE